MIGQQRLESVGQPKGTPGFMAPEAVNGVYTRAGDMYSLGATIFCLCEGRAPRGGGNDTMVSSGYPARLRSIISLCLSTNPAHRPPISHVIKQLAVALLECCLDGLPENRVAAIPRQPPPPPPLPPQQQQQPRPYRPRANARPVAAWQLQRQAPAVLPPPIPPFQVPVMALPQWYAPAVVQPAQQQQLYADMQVQLFGQIMQGLVAGFEALVCNNGNEWFWY
ncbi:kinase-like domain-containing protein [Lasiosphaeria ovina]|uniref:non-specific serine/threonine protein kinase n=1 Tax=Lasiosphaeria ovina TaxID=92902 RepID=A0AAE0JUC4_9PEZI|nr:kinase-like domain-containing protein [Lasiosphaeria ovina]